MYCEAVSSRRFWCPFFSLSSPRIVLHALEMKMDKHRLNGSSPASVQSLPSAPKRYSSVRDSYGKVFHPSEFKTGGRVSVPPILLRSAAQCQFPAPQQ